ncbi:DexA exonuclease A [Vibrio phage henriette 12B8]|uniref:exonuclease n=1 Tax=Vibrio phage henriette 12B8 TaxID=573174 RepID=UPI0002C110EC|nr:exonuclease [Vibrio phage henriette 12B8]AGG58234.1 DexA exonuclease A [Vibrio phage henriette 12B8]
MANNGKHILFDWETCGNAQEDPSVVVPSLGVIVFDPNELVPFDELVKQAVRFKFDVREQMDTFGRTTHQETIEWWRKPENFEAYGRIMIASGEDISLSQLGGKLDEYLRKMNWSAGVDGDACGRVWTRGNAFDAPLMTNIYKQFGWDEPFHFSLLRDVRTKIDAIAELYDPDHKHWGYPNGFTEPEGFIRHVEEHDCAVDVLRMQYVMLRYFNWLETNYTPKEK